MARLLVLGMATVDFVFEVDSFPVNAGKFSARATATVGGGIAANAATAAARLGGTVQLAARLGRDGMGDLILSDLVREGVDVSLVRRTVQAQSSHSAVLIDPAGERQIVNFRGSGLATDTGWIEDAARADAVLVDTRWPEGALVALTLARRWGVPGVVDGEPPIDPRLLAAASHLVFSRSGLLSLGRSDDLPTALAEIAAKLPGWICVTDGANGLWSAEPGGVAHTPAFNVTARDTLGAGDVWHGAFALALAEAQTRPSAIRFANATAALKCMTFGGRAGTPDRAAVTQFLKENSQ